MPSKRRGASGVIELEWHWSESGSGHREQESQSTLAGSGDSVILEYSSSDQNAITGYDDVVKEAYSISVDDLIRFIKTKGKKTS